MGAAEVFVIAHPILVWLTLGAVLLAMELHSGSGWLLWPAGSAAATGLFTLLFPAMSGLTQVALFAALTIMSTYVGRRYLRQPLPAGQDINDPHARLVGHHGKAIGDFQAGRGRVFVDGKEWSAESETGASVAKGDQVEVTAVLGGARVRVR